MFCYKYIATAIYIRFNFPEISFEMMLCMEHKGKRLLFFNITEDSPTTFIANRSELNILVLDKEVRVSPLFLSFYPGPICLCLPNQELHRF